jgi:hypothetical protein
VTRTQKIVSWTVVAAVGTLVVLTLAAAAGSRTAPLRRVVVASLEQRLNSDVELDAFSVDLFPSVVVGGAGLKLRLRNLPASVPPLIEIESFNVNSGLIDLIRRPRRFRTVALEGLVVNIPPGGLKQSGNPIADAAGSASQSNQPSDQPLPGKPEIVINELVADGATLRIIPRRAGKDPKVFAIHALTMRSLGRGQQMPFTATLTNPIPKGSIDTSGTFGPWQRDDPGSTPLAGRYTFKKAELDTIKGIGGILESAGEFSGALERIAVKGTTQTPDFHLDITRQPVALSTSFQAVVDGTDGDTYLDRVDAQFLQTSITAKGAVVGIKGVKGRLVKLNVQIHEGRIEDLLRLSVKGDRPMLVGRVALTTDMTLPPGDQDVVQKLELSGRFDVRAARFTDPKVSEKLSGFSARARGRDPDEKAADVVSNLEGSFKMKNGTMTFTGLKFGIPGALVELHGSYALATEALDFEGTVRMDATISQAVGAGGIKGFFLKALDPIFRKKGAGAIVPIQISGTADAPKFGLDVGRVFKN